MNFNTSTILNNFPGDKIKMNWNKNPILMEVFLSFLTVEVKKDEKCWGSENGWTQHTGENNLVVRGGVVNRVEYLDSLQYGKNIDNPYNNYVNPFHLFTIMTKEGQRFFFDYYSSEIDKLSAKICLELEAANQNKANFDEFMRLGVECECQK